MTRLAYEDHARITWVNSAVHGWHLFMFPTRKSPVYKPKPTARVALLNARVRRSRKSLWHFHALSSFDPLIA